MIVPLMLTRCSYKRPSQHVIAKLTDVYFSNCQNQPCCFSHEDNMRLRVQTSDLPEFLLLTFAATAVRYGRDDYFRPDLLVAVESYAREAWVMLKPCCSRGSEFFARAELGGAGVGSVALNDYLLPGHARRFWYRI
jgi:hypothetical protein